MPQNGHWTGEDAQLVARAMQRGWIRQDQAQQLSQHVCHYRAQGYALETSQALLQLQLLSAEQVQSLLNASGHQDPLFQSDHGYSSQILSTTRLDQSGSGVRPALQRSSHSSGRVDSSQMASELQGNFLISQESQRYQISDEVGKGGMGLVMKAHDELLHRQVAMKILKDLKRGSELRFVEEARLTGQLDHPNIVPVHDFGRDNEGRPFFTMKLIKGMSLREVIEEDLQSEHPRPLRRYLNIFVKMLEAMTFAHSHNIIHRDLKPENIMLGEFGEVYVMDWGVAKLLGQAEPELDDDSGRDANVGANLGSKRGSGSGSGVQSLRQDTDSPQWTIAGSICGTLNYMPPEQADGDLDRIDTRADIYALGCILYEMLTLKKAFSHEDSSVLVSRIFSNTYEDPQLAAPDRNIPPELSAVVSKAIQAQPEDRYASVRDLYNDIDAFLEGRAVSARRDPFLTRLRKWVVRHKTFAATATVSGIAAVVFSVMAFWLPGALIIDAGNSPKACQLWINGKLLKQPFAGAPKNAEGRASLRHDLWPPGPVTIKAEAPGYAPYQSTFLLASGAEKDLLLQLQRLKGSLTIASELGQLTAKLTNLGSQESLVLKAPFYGRDVPTGSYKIKLDCPGHFPKEYPLTVKAEQSQRLDVELEPISTWNTQTSMEIIDRHVVDVNQDGQLDLVLATTHYIEVQDLTTHKVLWRQTSDSQLEGIHNKNSLLKIADFDGDGQFEIVTQFGTEIHILDASTGLLESKFTRFFCRVSAIDVDNDSIPEIVCATPYRGTQVFRANGQRVWATATPRYSHTSSPKLVKISDSVDGIIITSSSPRRVYMLQKETGKVLWWRGFSGHSSLVQYSVMSTANGQSVIGVATLRGLLAIDAATGKELWTLNEGLTPIQSIASTQSFSSKEGFTAIRCVDRFVLIDNRGKVLWNKPCSPSSDGTFGDYDGDGQVEWFAVVRHQGLSDRSDIVVWDLKGQEKARLVINSDLNQRRGYNFPPIVVDTFGDGRPDILLTEYNSLKLLKLQSEQTSHKQMPRSVGLQACDLEDDGNNEVIEFDVYGIRCRDKNGPRWDCQFEFIEESQVTELGKAILPMVYGDLDGDQVKDIVAYAATWVTAVSGRTGKVIMRRLINGVFQGPRVVKDPDSARGLLVMANPEHFYVLRVSDDTIQGEVVTKWAWLKSDGIFITIDEPELRVIHVNGGRTLQARELKTGAVRWQTPLTEIVDPGLISRYRDRIFLPGSSGHVMLVRTDGTFLENVKVLGHLRSIIPRKGPEGFEFIALGANSRLAILDPMTGRPKRHCKLSQSIHFGNWRVSCFDLNNDGVDEIVASTESGYVNILEGRSLTSCFSSGRFLNPGYNILHTYRSGQCADFNFDGRKDLAIFGAYFNILYDISSHIRRAEVGHVSENPIIELSYLIRDVRYQRLESAETRTQSLAKTEYKKRAMNWLETLRGVKDRTNHKGRLGDTHMLLLISDLRQGRELRSQLPSTREVLSRAPLMAYRTLRNKVTQARERQILLNHIRQALQGQQALAKRLYKQAKDKLVLGDVKATTETLEALVSLMPWFKPGANTFVQRILVQASAGHNSFDRSGPINLLERGLAIYQDPRLHILLARILRQRIKDKGREVMDHHNKAVTLAAQDPSMKAFALAHRALFFVEAKRLPQAQQDIKAALQADPKAPTALAVASLIALSTGNNQQALQFMQAAEQRGFKDLLSLEWRIYQSQAQLYFASGQIEQGLESLRKAVLINGPSPSDPHKLLGLGKSLCEQGRLDLGLKIIRECQQLLTGEPQEAAERLYMAYEILSRARKVSQPQGWREFLLMAQAQLVQRRPQQAQVNIDKALASVPDDQRPELLTKWALTEVNFASRDDAVAHLKEALELEDDDAKKIDIQLTLARTLLKIEKDLAIRTILEAIKKGASPDRIAAHGMENQLSNERIRSALKVQ